MSWSSYILDLILQLILAVQGISYLGLVLFYLTAHLLPFVAQFLQSVWKYILSVQILLSFHNPISQEFQHSLHILPINFVYSISLSQLLWTCLTCQFSYDFSHLPKAFLTFLLLLFSSNFLYSCLRYFSLFFVVWYWQSLFSHHI